jgi:hypothetical protein
MTHADSDGIWIDADLNASFKGAHFSRMEATSWASSIYFMNCLIEELDASIDNIITEAFPNSRVVSPNLFISLSLVPVRMAMRSLLPISKYSLLNKLVTKSARLPKQVITTSVKLTDPVTVSLNWSCAKAIADNHTNETNNFIISNCIIMYMLPCQSLNTPISKDNTIEIVLTNFKSKVNEQKLIFLC